MLNKILIYFISIYSPSELTSSQTGISQERAMPTGNSDNIIHRLTEVDVLLYKFQTVFNLNMNKESYRRVASIIQLHMTHEYSRFSYWNHISELIQYNRDILRSEVSILLNSTALSILIHADVILSLIETNCIQKNIINDKTLLYKIAFLIDPQNNLFACKPASIVGELMRQSTVQSSQQHHSVLSCEQLHQHQQCSQQYRMQLKSHILMSYTYLNHIHYITSAGYNILNQRQGNICSSDISYEIYLFIYKAIHILHGLNCDIQLKKFFFRHDLALLQSLMILHMFIIHMKECKQIEYCIILEHIHGIFETSPLYALLDNNFNKDKA